MNDPINTGGVNVFVYGSLMFQAVLSGLTGWNGQRKPAVLRNHVRRSLSGLAWPCMVGGNQGDSVEGFVLFDLPGELLSVLDGFEGPEYRRIRVKPEIHGFAVRPGQEDGPPRPEASMTVEAWAWVWAGPQELIETKAWLPGDFAIGPAGSGTLLGLEPASRRYWLMKSEPSEVSIHDLAAMPGQRVAWFGVRNYLARNYMRDLMRPGDLAFFYHSSCPRPGIAGIVRIAGTPYPDPTQFEPDSPYFDPKAKHSDPRWFQVDVELVRETGFLDLAAMRNSAGLESLRMLQKGNRLSITPVEAGEWLILEALILEGELGRTVLKQDRTESGPV